MAEALRCAGKYDALLNQCMAMDVQDEEALKVAKKELEVEVKELHEMGLQDGEEHGRNRQRTSMRWTSWTSGATTWS
eukprot:2177114-Pyramimonas_sp.AAC.1